MHDKGLEGASLLGFPSDPGKLSLYAQQTIAELGLEPHPEGGWYRQTWKSEGVTGRDPHRNLGTCIYFLLPAGSSSAWHVVDADELWLWHGPGPVTLELGTSSEQPDEENAQRFTLEVSGESTRGQLIVPAGVWQRTVPSDQDALVSCVVCPGFTFEGFQLAN